jgi:hypothetical protein
MGMEMKSGSEKCITSEEKWNPKQWQRQDVHSEGAN